MFALESASAVLPAHGGRQTPLYLLASIPVLRQYPATYLVPGTFFFVGLRLNLIHMCWMRCTGARLYVRVYVSVWR